VGYSLAVVIPKGIASELKIEEGDEVFFEVSKNGVVLKKLG